MKFPKILGDLLCFVSIHEWRPYEEAVALRTAEACRRCTGWRFANLIALQVEEK